MAVSTPSSEVIAVLFLREFTDEMLVKIMTPRVLKILADAAEEMPPREERAAGEGGERAPADVVQRILAEGADGAGGGGVEAEDELDDLHRRRRVLAHHVQRVVPRLRAAAAAAAA